MKYLKGFSVFLAIFLLSSFVFSLDLNVDVCENVLEINEFLDFDLESCSIGKLNYSSCFSQGVLKNSDVYLNFNATNGTYSCELEVVGKDLSGMSAKVLSSDIGIETNLGLVNSINDGCIEKKYFEGNLEFFNNSETVQGNYIYDNYLNLSLDHNGSFHSIRLVCVKEVTAYDEDMVLESGDKLINSSFIINSTLSGEENFDLDFEYVFEVTTPNSVNFVRVPDNCVNTSVGGIVKLTCDRTLGQMLFEVKPVKTGSISYETKIDSALISSGSFNVRDIDSGELIVESNDLIFKTDSGNKNVSQLLYGDEVFSAQVNCTDSSANYAKLIIKNLNQRKTCDYYSNHKIGSGIFNVDMMRNVHSTNDCGNPLVLDKSGLYSFEVDCGGNLCSGSCYETIPAIVDVGDWDDYLILGTYLFSFYNYNQIPDCVCNANGELVPVDIFENVRTIHYQSMEDLVE